MNEFDEEDYAIIDDLVIRTSNFSVRQRDKRKLLKDAINHFTETEPLLTDFEFCGECDEDEGEVICICSQKIFKPYIIKHKDSSLKFRIGSTCFLNLYGKAECDNIHFFKNNCIYCKKNKVISRRNKYEKEGFCSEICCKKNKGFINCSTCKRLFKPYLKHHKLCRYCFNFKSNYGFINNNNKYIFHNH